MLPPNILAELRDQRQLEILAGKAPGRTTLPTPGSRSVRLMYHNVPVNMPPAPRVSSHMTDHPYSYIIITIHQVMHNHVIQIVFK